jgi:two-component system, chemotaxis family, CheB/CheR fusion protein
VICLSAALSVPGDWRISRGGRENSYSWTMQSRPIVVLRGTLVLLHFTRLHTHCAKPLGVAYAPEVLCAEHTPVVRAESISWPHVGPPSRATENRSKGLSVMGAKKDGPNREGRKTESQRKGEGTDIRKTTVPAEKVDKRRNLKGPGSVDFPIVGIGASAGGLEAFEQFFTHLPPDSGMAFVLVQHLDPTHKSMLTNLLRSYTRMIVREVEDGMAVVPNTVYVIPPNFEMAILHGKLHLLEPSAPRGPRQPIDFFFRSLSEDRQERGICIVLSGTGTEGTLGLRAIKGQGGMVMVQDPPSAKYDGMPRSAIATGLVDYILPPAKMPEQLIAYAQHPFSKEPGRAPLVEPDSTNSLHKILILIRSRTGHDFSQYKQSTIVRRIERRLAIHEIANMSDYVRYLQRYPEEADTLFKELLIGVTNFFRDSEAFECLKNKVIPLLFEDKNDQTSQLRVWVPGCSTGEEAYSLAILLLEYMEQIQRQIGVQIFATDIDGAAIETARSGIYPHGIVVDVGVDRLRRFFTKQDNAYHVKKEVRDMVVFAVQNATADPPFSKLDLISCRNLLIYMGSDLQKKLLPIFHYALLKHSFLFLGTSETVGEFSSLFTPIDRKWKIFQRKDTEVSGAVSAEFTAPNLATSLAGHAEDRGVRPLMRLTNQELSERALLSTYAAAGVLINEKSDILYFHGSTEKYLHPPVGEAHFNALSMAREGLKLELANAIRKASATKETVRYNRARVRSDDTDFLINLVVKPIWEPPSKRGLFMVVFEDVPPVELEALQQRPDETIHERAETRVREVEHELASTREYLQTTIEELETANEELKSTNEELQSANEELQSTNEELETSKEEQQSVNEELVTVNAELQEKIDALSKANDDMDNLLAASQIGTIFLDTDLNTQRFTPSIKKIINLIDADVGRPLRHIVHNLRHDSLVQDAEQVLATLNSKEIEVQTKTGNWYSMRMLPYRTTQNVIEGLVVTFVDISDRKRAEQKVQEYEQRYRKVEELASGVWTCALDGRLTYLSESFLEMTGLSWQDCEGLKWLEHMQMGNPKTLLAEWKRCDDTGSTWNHRCTIRDRIGNERQIVARGGPIKDEQGEITSWVGISVDLGDAASSINPCVSGTD